ncbi:MAG: hypothetical protein ACPGYV_01670 [Phycisphaeraceae bacterium]
MTLLRRIHDCHLDKLLLVLLILGGCGPSTKLVIQSEPKGGIISVRNAEGKVIHEGLSPTTVGLDYEDNAAYTITAIPQPFQMETYEQSQTRLDAASYGILPLAGDDKRTITVGLTKKDFVYIPEVREELNAEGNWVIVQVKRRSFRDIAETGGRVPALVLDLPEFKGITGMDISPDGRKVVFAESAYEKKLSEIEEATSYNGGGLILPSEGSNLRSVMLGSSGIQHITTESFNDKFPAFTPDSQHIVFASNRRRTNLSDILRVNEAGRSGIANIYVSNRSAMTLSPSFANDGTMVVEICEVDDAGGKVAVSDHYVWTIGGVNEYPTQIVKGSQPKISPDGKNIAYIGTDQNLWVSDVNGSNQIQLTTNATSIRDRYYDMLDDEDKAVFDTLDDAGIKPIYPYSHPSWSPDGKYILFASMEGNDPTGRPNEDIWIMDNQGGFKQQLTTNGSTDKYPLMSPDMKTVYFLSNRGERWAMWRIQSPLGE